MNEQKLIALFQNDAGRFINAETLALTALRKAIISGVLLPGETIDEEKVAQYLQISRMPIRQAMGILESEGLVKRIYRRGVIVTELSLDEIQEIYTIRALLEALATRKAVPKYTPRQLEALRASLQGFPDDAARVEQFVEVNHRFHLMLYEPCEWDRLVNLIAQLRNNTARYIGMARSISPRLSNSPASHLRIVEACEARDAELAGRLMHEHILNAMSFVIEELTRKEHE